LAERHRSGDNHWLTSSDVAEYCQVSKNTVLTWIRSNNLKAFSLPSGHYRIEMADFRHFLKRYDMPIKERFFATKSKGEEGHDP